MSSLSVRGPYFDELAVGTVLDTAPAVTLTEALQAVHQSITGCRLRLALDQPLSVEVTGATMAAPALVWDISIGQSTGLTQHVMANLFYRGLVFRRFPSIGDTLSTTCRVVALKENSRRADRRPSGLAVIRIETVDQHARPVLDYSRCAMLPLSPEAPETGAADDIGHVEKLEIEPDELVGSVAGWRLEEFRARVAGPHFSDLTVDQAWQVEGADLVSSGPELARLTGNLAAVHHDAAAGGGSRLVYGGHTIALALHQVTRALPNLVTVVGWRHCDHLGPVREGDLLTSTVSVEALYPRAEGGGGLADLRVLACARGEDGVGPSPVLDWRFWAVLA